MPSTVAITAPLIRDSIVAAIQNVCKTMMHKDATLCPESGAGASLPAFEMMANVGFAGDANGVVYLCLTDDFASFATGEILGMGPAEVQLHGYEVIKDAIGEITNMTAGGFKNRLCDVGFPCKLTLPTIVRGKDLSVDAFKGTERHIFRFECSGHVLLADIQFKAE